MLYDKFRRNKMKKKVDFSGVEVFNRHLCEEDSER